MPVGDAGETYLSARSLMARWDCSRRTVYRTIEQMLRLGLYSGIYLRPRTRRVALSAVIAFERYQAEHGGPQPKRLFPLPPTAGARQPYQKTRPAPRNSTSMLAVFLAAARGEDAPEPAAADQELRKRLRAQYRAARRRRG